MRTLFLSNCIPEPLNSGTNQRIYHLLRALAGVSDVTFVSPTDYGQAAERSGAFRSLCKEVRLFPRESFGWSQGSRIPTPLLKIGTAFRQLRPEPLLWQWYTSAQGRRLLEVLCLQNFDLVWVERLFLMSLLPTDLRSKVVVDLDDLEHRKLHRELGLMKSRALHPLAYLEYRKLRRVERRLHKWPYEFVVCSDIDKGLVGRGARVSVIPNGVDAPRPSTNAATVPAEPVIVFVGYMAYPPNVDAVQLFATQILPLIHREVPAAKFVIVGRDPAAEVLKLADNKTVFVTGTVPEVESYLRKASVVVAPLRVGGGTRIKILEAMGQGRPVVSTSIGAEGLAVESGRDILIANSPPDFAEACLRILRNPQLAQTLAANAFSLVQNKYEWSNIERSVVALVDRTLHANIQHSAVDTVPMLPPATLGQEAQLSNGQ